MGSSEFELPVTESEAETVKGYLKDALDDAVSMSALGAWFGTKATLRNLRSILKKIRKTVPKNWYERKDNEVYGLVVTESELGTMHFYLKHALLEAKGSAAIGFDCREPIRNIESVLKKISVQKALICSEKLRKEIPLKHSDLKMILNPF